jgi:hypothetical protein
LQSLYDIALPRFHDFSFVTNAIALIRIAIGGLLQCCCCLNLN